MDALSELLKVVELKGALFYNAEYSAPWSFQAPAAPAIASYLNVTSGHLILYHMVTQGSAWARIGTEPKLDLGPGDIVIFPHGDSHQMGNGAAYALVSHEEEIQHIVSQGLKAARFGQGGEVTKFVCGYLVCDPQLSRVLLGALPPILKVSTRTSESGRWIEQSVLLSVAHATSASPGSEAVLAKLSETLFVETLRQYISALPQNEKGWLAGVRDPEVGKALALLHRETARGWTIAELAREVGVSRSVLAERFRHYLGEAPIGYLTRWRLHLAARMLETTTSSVAQIGSTVGYDSEAAFNRAFKRQFGQPPARYRKASRPAITTSAAAGADWTI